MVQKDQLAKDIASVFKELASDINAESQRQLTGDQLNKLLPIISEYGSASSVSKKSGSQINRELGAFLASPDWTVIADKYFKNSAKKDLIAKTIPSEIEALGLQEGDKKDIAEARAILERYASTDKPHHAKHVANAHHHHHGETAGHIAKN